MLLPLDQVRQGLFYSDRDVRDSVAHFFSNQFVDDPEAMPLAIRCIDELSWHEAFSNYEFLSALGQTEATLGWLIERLRAIGGSRSGLADHVRAAVVASIVDADTHVLSRRLSELLSFPALDRDARNAIIERI